MHSRNEKVRGQVKGVTNAIATYVTAIGPGSKGPPSTMLHTDLIRQQLGLAASEDKMKE